MNLLLILQKINIEDKLNKAPDKSYETGLVIGSFLPFIVLIGIAYLMYYKAKKNNLESNNE